MVSLTSLKPVFGNSRGFVTSFRAPTRLPLQRTTQHPITQKLENRETENWEWETGRMGDGRMGETQKLENGRWEDRRRETGDGRRETGDERRETGDGRWETGDGRRETGDRRREDVKDNWEMAQHLKRALQGILMGHSEAQRGKTQHKVIKRALISAF
ncbi:uncharacterized protein F5147DRAFT_651853 [Suillus discolor]|uniref:Uncharacterized protein n=1 Tax=Suillus discolor TaxID=1912936 RepID=A0A9P7F9L9_9AGAM|nr:uncharacterized protein F5147DRAFT_651853 [Suillus discolor]KAG2110682.1 hypothetical protein F5147DRAFT_651853 [Suillus discolor]